MGVAQERGRLDVIRLEEVREIEAVVEGAAGGIARRDASVSGWLSS